jgi:glycosyltransferase involved in cell wall biosynthesis
MDFVKKSKANIKIYDQYDIHHMDINGNIDKKLESMNNDLIKISDIVFSTSEYLHNKSKKLNKNSFYITNGNNFELLSNKIKKIPAKINLPIQGAKTIGYLGGIRDWIDFNLLEYVIEKMSDVNFLFIGSIYRTALIEMEKLKSYKNVIWINYIQPENLPSYLSLFDAGIIPFKTTEFFKSVFPNKFYEYLASGIPVITTNLPELKKYENLIGYSYEKKDFLENCESALRGYYKKYKGKYIKISEENSWSEKAEDVLKIIEKTYLNIIL